MDIISTIHGTFSNTIWLFFLIIGLWGLVRAIQGLGVDGSYLGACAIAQILYVVQAILGTFLIINGRLYDLSRPSMHILYGVFALVFLPFVYLGMLRGDDSNRAQWVLSFATLFLFGIALRGITTSL